MTKKEKLKQLAQAQKELLKQLENDDRVANPNLKKGRRSFSQIFNNVNTKTPML